MQVDSQWFFWADQTDIVHYLFSLSCFLNCTVILTTWDNTEIKRKTLFSLYQPFFVAYSRNGKENSHALSWKIIQHGSCGRQN